MVLISKKEDVASVTGVHGQNARRPVGSVVCSEIEFVQMDLLCVQKNSALLMRLLKKQENSSKRNAVSGAHGACGHLRQLNVEDSNRKGKENASVERKRIMNIMENVVMELQKK